MMKASKLAASKRFLEDSMSGKWLELLKEVAPHVRSVAYRALAAAGRVVLGFRSGERWPCRPWRGERAVCRFGSRYRPIAGPRARWFASRGGRRFGSRAEFQDSQPRCKRSFRAPDCI